MANYAQIKNNKKLSSSQALSLIRAELLKKFNLVVNEHQDGSVLSLSTEHVSFVFFCPNEAYFEFYDVSDNAFIRHSTCDNPYWEVIHARGVGGGSVYEYVLEYIKNYLAYYNNTTIDSEGSGEYQAFAKEGKYDSFDTWTKANYSNNSLLGKTYLEFIHYRTKKLERQFFPTLV